MKKCFQLFFLLLIFIGNDLFGQKVEWVKPINGILSQSIFKVAIGPSKEVIQVGSFNDTTRFDGNTITPPNNSRHIFITKHDSLGNLLWVKYFGNASGSTGAVIKANDIAVDQNGNIYICGGYRATVDFDPDTAVVSRTSYFSGITYRYDIFLLKLNGNGQFDWLQTMGSNADEEAYSVITDKQNNVILCGNLHGIVDFDPGPGVFYLSGHGASFIQKLDEQGNFEWAKHVFASFSTVLMDFVNIYSGDEIVVSGKFTGNVDFDPSPTSSTFLSTNSSSSYFRRFILQLDSSGNFQRVGEFTNSGSHDITSVNVNRNNNMVFTGFFTYTLDLDPRPTSTYSVQSGFSNNRPVSFLAKLDSNWNIDFAHTYSGFQQSQIAEIDPMDNVHFSLTMNDEIDVDPSNDSMIIEVRGSATAVYVKYQPNGALTYTKPILDGYTTINDIVSSGSNTFVVGKHYGNLTLGYGSQAIPIANSGNTDAFQIKFNDCSLINIADTLYACAGDTTTVASSHYTVSGRVRYINSAIVTHCDTLVTMELIYHPAQNINQTVDICFNDSVVIGSHVYRSNGTYIDQFTNQFGCDSTITTTVNVIPGIASNQTIQICFGDTLSVGNSNYFQSGNYTDTLLSIQTGCDSTVVTTLTVNQINIQIDTTRGDTLFAIESNANYQWLDCSNGYSIIPNATNQFFVPGSNGQYAVSIDKINCTDTSDCLNYIIVGINDENAPEPIAVYPNPNNGKFRLESSKGLIGKEFQLLDLQGQIVYQSKIASIQTELNIKRELKGMYFLMIRGLGLKKKIIIY